MFERLDFRDLNCTSGERARAVSPGRQVSHGQRSMGRRVVRLRGRSSSTGQSRVLLWLVLGSRRGSEVEQAWDGVGCSWSGR